jgi:nucleotide-binding universal stress UspA family protein
MDHVATTVDASGAILVGHDGSAPSAQAVRWAAKLAGRIGCPLLVVRTWALSSAPRPATWAPGYVPPLTDFEDAVLHRLRADVEALHLGDGVEVSCHVLHGSAGRRLVESSKGAEMLVVGSRGVGGFRGLMLGSTASQVVGNSACPVVVVPVKGDEHAAPLDTDVHQA